MFTTTPFRLQKMRDGFDGRPLMSNFGFSDRHLKLAFRIVFVGSVLNFAALRLQTGLQERQVPAPIVENCFGPVWDRMELWDGCK
jgi:hypothetical protein